MKRISGFHVDVKNVTLMSCDIYSMYYIYDMYIAGDVAHTVQLLYYVIIGLDNLLI